jgi:hypothetical protein
MVLDDKAIKIYDVRAIRLAKARALKENRSFANAAAVSIIERLGGQKDNNQDALCQGKYSDGDRKNGKTEFTQQGGAG